jgi:hypothetical protein
MAGYHLAYVPDAPAPTRPRYYRASPRAYPYAIPTEYAAADASSAVLPVQPDGVHATLLAPYNGYGKPV